MWTGVLYLSPAKVPQGSEAKLSILCKKAVKGGKTTFFDSIDDFFARCNKNETLLCYEFGKLVDFFLVYALRKGLKSIPEKLNHDGCFFVEQYKERVLSISVYINQKRVCIRSFNALFPYNIGEMTRIAWKNESKEQTAERRFAENVCGAMRQILVDNAPFIGRAYTFSGVGYRLLKAAVGSDFRFRYPTLPKPAHDFIRRAMYGGMCMYDKKRRGKRVTHVYGYDYHALFPNIMMRERLPEGPCYWFEGEPPKDTDKGWIVSFTCFFAIKDDGVPFLTDPCDYMPNDENNEYYSCGYKILSDYETELTMCEPDFRLFLENYDVWDLKFKRGIAFDLGDTIKKAMPEIVNYRDGEMKYSKFAKRCTNGIWGRFAIAKDKPLYRWEITERGPYDIPTPVCVGMVENDAAYIPVAVYMFALARQKIIPLIKAHKKEFLYSDTDSIYLTETLPDDILIDKQGYILREVLHDGEMRVLAKKRYLTVNSDGTLELAMAGIPQEALRKLQKWNPERAIAHLKAGFPIRYKTMIKTPGGCTWGKIDYILRV